MNTEQILSEIREANQSFNQMVQDLQKVETDRAMILAGISHDLRTPIARMLLEVEMANLPEESRLGMQSDLAQMEAIIAQFLDYARPADASRFSRFDLTALLERVVIEAIRQPDVKMISSIAPNLQMSGNETEIMRMMNNLVENARRYGKTADKNYAELSLTASCNAGKILISLTDNGVGLPTDQIHYLLQPFTRLDHARGQANGAGLGLAIVDRVIQRHHGQLEISNQETGGLIISITFASA